MRREGYTRRYRYKDCRGKDRSVDRTGVDYGSQQVTPMKGKRPAAREIKEGERE